MEAQANDQISAAEWRVTNCQPRGLTEGHAGRRGVAYGHASGASTQACHDGQAGAAIGADHELGHPGRQRGAQLVGERDRCGTFVPGDSA
jgi:hypothetical protein